MGAMTPATAPAESVLRPTGAAVTAALTPFLGLPVTIAIFALAVGAFGRGGSLGSLAMAWRDGGWPMYLVLGLGGVVSIVSAPLMFFGVHRGSVAVLANAPLASVLAAAGAAGYWLGMNGAISAISFASPADRATLLAAGFSEAINSSLFGLAAMAGLLVCLALGALFGFAAQTGVARTLMGSSMACFGALAVVAGVSLKRLAELMEGFRALANAAPDQRVTLLVEMAKELERYRTHSLAALGLLVVVLAVGAVLLKSSPRAAVLLPLLGLGGLVGLGTQAMARVSIDSMAPAMGPPLGLITLDGLPSNETTWCLSDVGVVDCRDGAPRGEAVTAEALEDELGAFIRRLEDLEEARGEDRAEVPVPLGVTPKATASGLGGFVTAALTTGATRLELQGEIEPRPLELPSEFSAFSSLVTSRLRMVPVGLAWRSKRCPDGCELAAVTGDALKVGAETWTAASLATRGSTPTKEVLIASDPSMTPQTLARLAMAACAKDRLLVVVVSDPNELRDASPGLSTSDAEALRGVVRSHLKDIRVCYERALTKDPLLKGKVTVSWVVTKTGSVADVSIAEQTMHQAGVAECVAAKVRRWTFPKPTGGQDVTVKYPFIFEPVE
jgi:hypothetical protein